MFDPRVILQSPFVYETYQLIVGGKYMRDVCRRRLDVKEGQRVLDIGCGPAYYLPKLPPVEYYGFDTDARYIDYAKGKYGDRGHFYCEEFDANWAKRLGAVDRIMLMGLLHHLDDAACEHLLSLLGGLLRPGGRLIALETVTHPKQSRFERMLALGDRGQYVREPEAFLEMARRHFPQVTGSLPEKKIVPSIYWVIECKSPAPAQQQAQ